ncbi:Putative storage protein LPV [Phytophthora palmivora]|uniref:Storage protein LPV n=1 Tax=Phytophthora palmivora TaxID=4796 RepID=A0A2P4YKN6_9STRA|nr:Putative storage protein LPV [Phytophthora palmivora]
MDAQGRTTTTVVDVTRTWDGKSALELPMGPEGQTTTVTIPSTATGSSGGQQNYQTGGGGETTTDILNQLGGNDIDNGDKDFMSKDEFQLQIGAHYSEKIMALKEQAKDEEVESDKMLRQQKALEDCIFQAANKFGYYGVYEQPPYFKNAVNWVDNDCIKQ